MARRRNRRALTGFGAALLTLAACSQTADPIAEEAAAPSTVRLGLMTSLPLYWPLDAELADLAAGTAPLPWQRTTITARYALVPLDTLSPVPALSPDAAETDPLAGLDRLAVIQPRGLSPADNVALDGWVRAGGRLLLVLDPALTGDYDLPLGDPRRPVDGALIPPVAARWGLAVSFDAGQPPVVTYAPFGAVSGARPLALPLALAGRIALDGSASDCILQAEGAMAVCRVGKGRVTLIADAALFEHAELAGENGAGLLGVLEAAFE